MISADDDAPPGLDAEAAVEHVRNAWLNLRVFDHVETGLGGGYAFDPSDYAPVPVEQDGQTTVVFART
jgi:hypothetical protein